jgi:hypothetical protein
MGLGVELSSRTSLYTASGLTVIVDTGALGANKGHGLGQGPVGCDLAREGGGREVQVGNMDRPWKVTTA